MIAEKNIDSVTDAVIEHENEISLEAYLSAVEFFARTKSDFIFPNSSPEHASIVLATIFKYSTTEVLIYDNSINGDIADSNQYLLDAIKNYVEKTSKVVKIVIRDDSKHENSKIYNLLSGYIKEKRSNIDIRKATKNFRDEVVNIYDKDINFAVGDKTSFRMEKNDSTETNIQREAICSFNRTSTANKLSSVFENHFSVCPKVIFD